MTGQRRTIAAAVLVVLSLAALAGAQRGPARPARTFVAQGMRLISGAGGPAIDDAAIVVREGKIVEVGRRGALRTDTSGLPRVDLSGKFVMPALVDAHVHLGYRSGTTFTGENFSRATILDQLNRFAYYGVGAVLSTGTDRSDLVLSLRREPHAGALVRTAWRGIAAPGGGPFPPMRDAPFGVATEVEARDAVRQLAAHKADLIKIWVDDRNHTVQKLSPALYGAVIDEAHRHGLRVVAHTTELADVKALLRAGVDGFAHLFRDREADEEVVRLLRDRPRVFFMLTLWAPRLATETRPPAWIDDPRLRDTIAPDVLAQFAEPLSKHSPEALRAADADWRRLQASVKTLSAAGVRLVLGTDVGGNTGFGLFGWTEHIELANMVDAGLSPSQAIVAATSAAAAAVGLPDRGTIAAGKSADFVVLDADPLADIANTRTIARVYLGGEEVDRAALAAAWRARSTS